MRSAVPMAERVRYLAPSEMTGAIRAGQAPGAIPFTVGSPGDSMVPSTALADAFAAVWGGHRAGTLSYGPPEGHPELREFLAWRQSLRGVDCTADNVIVTHGSQQGLDLVAKLLLDRGDVVVVEAPSYPGALDAFSQYGVEFAPVAMDDEGMRPDELEEILRRQRPDRPVRLVYTVPTFQNPSGRTMSERRRREILAIVARHRVPVVEDDPYGELSFGGPAPTPLQAIDDEGLVIALGSLSKLVTPGLRLGWVVAPGPLRARLLLLKERTDLLTATAPQLVALRVCGDGALERHLDDVRPRYARRRDAMVNALTRELAGECSFARPDGGFFVWLTLPEHLDARAVTAAASTFGVAVMPGTAFHTDAGGRHAVRLSYSAVSTTRIREGVRRLAAAVRTEAMSGRVSMSREGRPA